MFGEDRGSHGAVTPGFPGLTRGLPSPDAFREPGRIVALVARRDDWLGHLAQLSAVLAEAEHARIARLRNAADRQARTIAYGLHRILVGHALGLDPGRVPLGRDGKGCPRLAGVPMFTSLSHADGFVAFALTSAGPVGIDLEPGARAPGLLEIESSVCHPLERAVLAAGASQRARDLLRLWVRKEAVLKAAGVGLEIEMNAFSVMDGATVRLPGASGCRLGVSEVAMPGLVVAVAGTPAALVDCRAWSRTGPGSPRLPEAGGLGGCRSGASGHARKWEVCT